MSLNYDHGHLRVTYRIHNYVPYTKIGAVTKTIIIFWRDCIIRHVYPKGEASNRDALSSPVCIYVCMYVCMYVYIRVRALPSVKALRGQG